MLHWVKDRTNGQLDLHWRYFSLEQVNQKHGPDWKLWEQPETYPSRGRLSWKGAEAARQQGPAAFERFLVGLLRAGYRPTSLAAVDAALGGAIEPPRGCLVLSFDDGLLSQFEHALPVLRAQNAPAVFFVMPGFADGVHRYMTARELRALADAGMEVGAHTCNHANLPALARANAGAFLAELVDCRRLLERTIGRPVRYLAYPYGAVDAEVLRGVARAGYRAAFTTRPATLLPAGAPLLLPRVLVDVSAGAWPVVERLRALDGLSGPLGEGGPGLLPTPV